MPGCLPLDSLELRKLKARLNAERVAVQRENALKDHVLRMTKMQNHKLKTALIRLRQASQDR